MSVIPEAEPRLWMLTVHDRDGGIINDDDGRVFESEAEALKAGEFFEDDPRYGSHEAERV